MQAGHPFGTISRTVAKPGCEPVAEIAMSSTSDTPIPPSSRRAFLMALGAAPTAFVDTGRTDDADDLAGFLRLVDLDYSDAERGQAKGELADLRGHYRQLRKAEFPFALPPSVHFAAVPPPPALPSKPSALSWTPKVLPPPKDGAPPPWLGMYGFGEFARLGGRNTYHNYTSALYVICR